MGAVAGFSAVALTLYGGIQQAQVQKAQKKEAERQARFNQQIGLRNARISEMEALEELERGEEAEFIFRRETKRLMGSQRAALAAQGLEVEEDSALSVLMSTARMGEEDAMRIRYNAMRSAHSLEQQAAGQRLAAQLGRVEYPDKSKATLITAGAQALALGARTYQYSQGRGRNTSTKTTGSNTGYTSEHT